MDFSVSICKDLRSFRGYETPPASSAFRASTLADIIKMAEKVSHRHHIKCGQCLFHLRVIIAETEWKFS